MSLCNLLKERHWYKNNHITSDVVSDIEKYICLCNNKLTNEIGIRKL